MRSFANPRRALALLGAVMLVVGALSLRLVQHDLHVAEVTTAASEALAHAERVRAVSQRLNDAVDAPRAVFERIATARIGNAGDELLALRGAVDGLTVARRDTLAAADAFRAETGADLRAADRRIVRADEAQIVAFLDASHAVEEVIARPNGARPSSLDGARTRLAAALTATAADYRAGRETVLELIRSARDNAQGGADAASREAARWRDEGLAEALLRP